MRVTKKQIAQLREQLHQTIDGLPDGAVRGLTRLLQDDYVRGLLNTPDGETPLNPEELSGLIQAELDAKAGRVRSFSTMEDLIADLHAHAQSFDEEYGAR